MLFSEYSIEWQEIHVLLYALENISGGTPSRRCTVEYIQREGLLSLRPEDHDPYPSQKEPSWCTDVAWARKNAVMLGYVHNIEWDSWDISREGRDYLKSTMQDGHNGRLEVCRCFLWTAKAKRLFDPTYVSSPLDTNAPPKGQRSLPNIQNIESMVDVVLKYASLEELAVKLSRDLGSSIPATKPSVAFAWWTQMQRQENASKQTLG